jgi:Protein of unknown function (DUF3499)
MGRQCARPACSAPAAATFNFDGLKRVVWLGPLTESRNQSAGDLCRRHADRLRPPMHWELRDLRPGATSHVAAAPAAPSRHIAPEAPPPAPLPLEPVGQLRAPATAAASASRSLLGPRPETDEHDLSPEEAAASPLLARAFRAAG